MGKVFAILGKVLNNVKNFGFLDRSNFNEKVLELFNEEPMSFKSAELSKVLFYVLFNKVSLQNLKLDLASHKSIFNGNELKIVEIILGNNLDGLKGVDSKVLVENYGKLSSKKIFIYFSIFLILNKN
jgi:hypothetical protein